MTKQRKAPSTSTTAAIQAMVNASKPMPDVPAHMTLEENQQPFWTAIIRARARDEWTEADLVLAVQLARCQAEIEIESAAMKAEGSIVTNARGTQIPNPRATLLQQFAMRQLALMRSLRMTGVVLSGNKKDLVQKRALERDASQAKASLEEDEDLLAI